MGLKRLKFQLGCVSPGLLAEPRYGGSCLHNWLLLYGETTSMNVAHITILYQHNIVILANGEDYSVGKRNPMVWKTKRDGGMHKG